MDHSIQDIARLAGTTSRTLRHYGAEGLLLPSRIGENGYRYYDERALVRLQRILLLRDLGLGLPAIREVLDREVDETAALTAHLGWLEQEQRRLQRQIRSVRTTITALEGEEPLMADTMFDGFDHTTYKEEVEERWGNDAYARGDSWWTSMSATEKKEWQARLTQLHTDWIAAAGSKDPASDTAQALAKRHAEWLATIPGTPELSETYPGELYVSDDRFASNYGGLDGARFVRDALAIYLRR